MALYKGMIKNLAAAGMSLAITMALAPTASAQFGPPPDLYTPEPEARDLKSALMNWTWHMGMLRGIEEHELIVSLEYRAEGTIKVNGQDCRIAPFEVGPREGELGSSGYRISASFQEPGYRTQINCTLPNGETYSNVEVLSGNYAWDASSPGAGLVSGEGNVTAMPDTLAERRIRLWASPFGAAKAALAGTGIPLRKVWRNPGGLLEGGSMTLGDTSVRWEGTTPVISFPIPGVEGATGVARLDDRFMAESVVVTHEGNTYEFEYGDNDDYNNDLHLIEVYMAGTMTESKNGEVMRDLRTRQTETGSVYVVVPVPPSVSGMPVQPVDMYGTDQEAPVLSSTAPTPRLADGKPDLTGMWSSPSKFFIWNYGSRRCAPTQLDGCSTAWNQTIDFAFEAASRFGPNRPIYRPEHWDEVIWLDMWTNRYDPIMTCQPMGIPRQGAPGRIFHTENDITLLYGSGGDGGGGYPEFRVIATDGRQISQREVIQTKYTGHSVGHWEGDTLVIESIGFTPATWLARGGFFHSEDMKVTERFTRQGNEVMFEVTVEDPQVLLQPWKMTPMLMTLADEQGGDNARASLVGVERGHCQQLELDDIVTQYRH